MRRWPPTRRSLSALLFKAFALFTLSEKKYLPDVAAALDAARAHASIMTQRERRLLAAGDQLVRYEWHEACRLWGILVDHPRDLAALIPAHLFDFYRGDSLNLRKRIARVLPAWSASVPLHSYVLGQYAFGMEECNLYSQAREFGERALALEPKDPWAMHAAPM